MFLNQKVCIRSVVCRLRREINSNVTAKFFSANGFWRTWDVSWFSVAALDKSCICCTGLL